MMVCLTELWMCCEFCLNQSFYIMHYISLIKEKDSWNKRPRAYVFIFSMEIKKILCIVHFRRYSTMFSCNNSHFIGYNFYNVQNTNIWKLMQISSD